MLSISRIYNISQNAVCHDTSCTSEVPVQQVQHSEGFLFLSPKTRGLCWPGHRGLPGTSVRGGTGGSSGLQRLKRKKKKKYRLQIVLLQHMQ